MRKLITILFVLGWFGALAQTTPIADFTLYLKSTTAASTYAPIVSPSLTTPTLGVATATSINKVTITSPATSATLTLITGSTLQTTGAFTLNLTTTANSTPTFPTGTGTLPYIGNNNIWTGPQLFNPSSTFSTTSATSLFGGASTVIALGNLVGPGTAPTLTTGANYANFIDATATVKTFTSGTHALIAGHVFKPVVITANGATVTKAVNSVSYPATGGASNFNWWFNGGVTEASQFQVDTLTASMGVGTDANKRLVSISVPQTQSTADLTAQTAAATVTTFTVGSSTATFNISGYVNITAVTVDIIEMQVTYTDENSTSQTANFFTQGATSALLSSIGNSVYPPMTIRAKNGTVITVKTTLTTGTGSISYDCGSRITQL